MSDQTGMAPGRVTSIIYFASQDGQVILPPTTEDARWLYRTHYQNRGWEWCEASTLAEVDALQDRLCSLDKDKREMDFERDERKFAEGRERIRSSIYQRMISSSTSPFMRDFYWYYLHVHQPEKREQYRQRYFEATSYLWSREMDNSTKATDRMISEPGDRWERSG
jgi:hypothetical protein